MTWFENLKTQIQRFQVMCGANCCSLQMVYMPQVCAYTSHVEPLVTRPYLYLPAYDTSEIWQLHQLVGWSQQKSQEFGGFRFLYIQKFHGGFSTGTSWSKVTFSHGWRAKLRGLAFAADDHRLLNNRALCYAALKMWGKCQEGRGFTGLCIGEKGRGSSWLRWLVLVSSV